MSGPGAIAAAAAALACVAAVAAAAALRRAPVIGAAETAAAERQAHTPGRRARRARRRAVHAEIPQLLDLLAAGSTAGLSAELSLREATMCLRGPLGEDLGSVVRAVDLGVSWRAALADYARASGEEDLGRTVAVLARTEALGVSLTDATRELAASVRDARRTATLERARTAPVKMLFPLVFLILPAFLLLTVVPVLITTVRSID